jgi:hypothetical protein
MVSTVPPPFQPDAGLKVAIEGADGASGDFATRNPEVDHE